MKFIMALFALSSAGIAQDAVYCPATKQHFATVQECTKHCPSGCSIGSLDITTSMRPERQEAAVAQG